MADEHSSDDDDSSSQSPKYDSDDPSLSLEASDGEDDPATARLELTVEVGEEEPELKKVNVRVNR